LSSFLKKKVISKCDNCPLQKKGLSIKQDSPYILKENGKDILIIMEDKQPSDRFKKFDEYVKNYFSSYTIVSGVNCGCTSGEFPSPVYSIYKYCNLITEEFTKQFKVVITVGSALNAITQTADISSWENFSEFLFNQTYFYTPFQWNKKIRVYPIPRITYWMDRDTFEGFFVKKQIVFIKEYLKNYTEYKIDPYEIIDIKDNKQFSEIINENRNNKLLTWDTETNSLNTFVDDFKIGCITFTYDGKKGYYWPFDETSTRLLNRFYQDKYQITANGKYDLKALYNKGADNKRLEEDITLLYHLLNTERKGNGLKALAWLIGFGGYDKKLDEYIKKYKIGNYLDIPKNLLLEYSVLDAIVTHRLYEYAVNHLIPLQPRVYEAYKKYVIPSIPVFLKMEINGMYIDKEYLNTYHNKLQREIKEIEIEICKELNKNILVSSNEQLGYALKEYGLPNLGETKKGFYQTGDEKLVQWKQLGFGIADKILRHRQLMKLDNSFVGNQIKEKEGKGFFETRLESEDEKETGIVKYIMSDGKVHSTYMPAITSSWRSASSDPNGQNYLKHGEEGKAFRKIFKCPENYLIGEADFAGFQLRIAAILSKDKVMEDIFLNKGADIHSLNAVAVYCRNMTIDEFLKVKGEEPYKTFRYKAKNQFSFPLLFSSSAYVIYATIKNEWSEKELKDYIEENKLIISKDRNDQDDLVLTVINDIYKKYFETYPELKQWILNQHKTGKEKGYTDSIHGCRRHLPRLLYLGTNLNREELSKQTNLLNIATNSCVQSFEFIEACRALIEIDSKMVEQKVKSLLVGMVHDSDVVYIHKDEIEIMYKIIMESMSSNEYSIPIVGELALGEIWGFGKEVTEKNIEEFVK